MGDQQGEGRGGGGELPCLWSTPLQLTGTMLSLCRQTRSPTRIFFHFLHRKLCGWGWQGWGVWSSQPPPSCPDCSLLPDSKALQTFLPSPLAELCSMRVNSWIFSPSSFTGPTPSLVNSSHLISAGLGFPGPTGCPGAPKVLDDLPGTAPHECPSLCHAGVASLG